MKWKWWWGYEDKTSEPIEFNDFNKMKSFSATHSFVTKNLVTGYWSTYEPV